MKEKIENISLFVVLFTLFLFKDLFYLVPLKCLNINYDELSYSLQTLLSLLASIVITIIVFIIYRKYLKEKLKDYKAKFNEYFDFGFKIWFLGLAGMCITNILIGTFSPVKQPNNEVLVQEMLKVAPFLSFISASLIAPFLEEMIFRKALGDIFKNKTVKIIMCGLIFGLLHVVFSLETPWDLLYVIPYGLLGSSFAYIMCKKENVLIPITFHMIHNGILTLLSIITSVI